MNIRHVVRVVLGLAAAAGLGGCAVHRAPLSDLPSRELAGHYVSGPGDNWFRPCGAVAADPAWWVTLTGRAVEQAERARTAGQLVPGQRYFVRWSAAVTTGGEVGPRGPGAPAVLVRDVLELRPAAASDCAGR